MSIFNKPLQIDSNYEYIKDYVKNNSSLTPPDLTNAISFFDDNKLKNPKLPDFDILKKMPIIVERLDRSNWNTDRTTDEAGTLETVYIIESMLKKTSLTDEERKCLLRLKEFFDNPKFVYMPNMTKLPVRAFSLMQNKKYNISNSTRRAILTELNAEAKEHRESVLCLFARELQPKFDKFGFENFDFRPHQKFALLWVFYNFYDNKSDNNKHRLIKNKTRSGKSELIVAITILDLILSRDSQYKNTLYTGEYPSITGAVKKCMPKYAIDGEPVFNIMDMKVNPKDPLEFSNFGINAVFGSFGLIRPNYEFEKDPITGKNLKVDNAPVRIKDENGDDIKNYNPRVMEAHKRHFASIIIDEAHDSTFAALTQEALNKFTADNIWHITATDNREEFDGMPACEFSYREEQNMKKQGCKEYANAPKRVSIDLGVYYPLHDVVQALGYDDVDDYIFYFQEKGECRTFTSKKAEKKFDVNKVHNNTEMMDRIILTAIKGINSTQYNTESWDIRNGTVRRTKQKLLSIVMQKVLSSLNQITKVETLIGHIDSIAVLTKTDLKNAGDTIFVMESIIAGEILKKYMKRDKNLSVLFEIRNEHYKTPKDERLGVAGLEDLTSLTHERKKPRIIILCRTGLQGSTFETVNGVIHFYNINSPARYKQAIERGGEYAKGKDEYYIMDFNGSKLINFGDGIEAKDIHPGGGVAPELSYADHKTNTEINCRYDDISHHGIINFDNLLDLSKTKYGNHATHNPYEDSGMSHREIIEAKFSKTYERDIGIGLGIITQELNIPRGNKFLSDDSELNVEYIYDYFHKDMLERKKTNKKAANRLTKTERWLWMGMILGMLSSNKNLFDNTQRILVPMHPGALAYISDNLSIEGRKNLFYLIDPRDDILYHFALGYIPEENIILLDLEFKEENKAQLEKFKTMRKFKNIVTNPAYQDPHKKTSIPLWTKAMALWNCMLEDGGLLGGATPASWVGKTTDTRNNYDVYTKNQIQIVEFFDVASRPFSEATTVSWYVIKKEPPIHETKVFQHINKCRHDIGSMFLDKRAYPIIFTDLSLSINDKLLGFEGMVFERDHYFHPTNKASLIRDSQDDIFKYRLWISSDKGYKYISEKGNNQENYETWKVMIGSASTIDKCVVANNTTFCPDVYAAHADSKEEAEWKKDNLCLTVSRYIGISYRAGGSNLKSLFKSKIFPAIILSRRWTDAELYSLFNFTVEEIEYIERIAK